MKILTLYFILYVNYCSCQYSGGLKKSDNPYPKKVGFDFIQYNYGGKYVKPVTQVIEEIPKKSSQQEYTVFAKPFPTLEAFKIHHQIVPDSPYFPVDEPNQPERRSRVKQVLPDYLRLRQKRSADDADDTKSLKNTPPSLIENKAKKLKSPILKNGEPDNGVKKIKAPLKRNKSITRFNSDKKRGDINRTGKNQRLVKNGVKSQKLRDLRNKRLRAPQNGRISKKQSQPGLVRTKLNSQKKLSKSDRKLKAQPQRGVQKLKNKNVKSIAQSQRNNTKVRGSRNPKDFNARRLIGAKDALIEEYPYTVSIQKDGNHWCSGALLNPRIIITTANCLWRSNSLSRLRVRAGSRHTDRGGQVTKIQEVMKHPGWKLRRNPDNDLALALLDRKIRFSHAVHAVDLPNRVMLPPFDDAWVTSWGAERRDGIYDSRSVNLQSYHARVLDRVKCNNVTKRFGVAVNENFICLTQTSKRAPCTRDTGAPAVSDGVLWGLASWGIRKLCGTERFPAMFSYTASHANMNFLTNATHYLMSEERNYPFLDRYPIVRATFTTPTTLTLPH